MIKISNVTKIYKSKKKGRHKALDNISFNLPNKGIVFVLGKSGSGKSTFLNLLGGLDSITSGTIVVDGNNISTLRESEFANYRNTHIGFIFQDYHLVDELTVYENIVLSLNLRREEDKGDVLKALNKVGLSGYENRFPDELSGGERQRVAIARAIVKKPRIILADEPTGNLDNNTGSQIIKLLKGLSNDCLIVVVSHNLNDASTYGDRIIELSKGRVIADLTRNPSFKDTISYSGDTIIYPGDMKLSKEDINDINTHLKTGKYHKFLRVYDKFIPTKSDNYVEEKHEIINKNLSKRNTSKFTLKFLKNKVFSIILTSFMVASIMTIFSLAGSFVTFDSSRVINDKLEDMKINSVSMDKILDDDTRANLSANYRVEIGKDDIQTFNSANIGGQVIPIYSHTIPIKSSNNQFGTYRTYDFLNDPILQETLGTILVDENMIINTYGKLEYVALNENIEPYGIYISDYVADCILLANPLYSKKGYDDILGYVKVSNANYTRAYVNGIINTNYKERYASLFNKFKPGVTVNYTDLIEDEGFIDFSSEVYSLLGFNMTFNPNFKEDFIQANFLTLVAASKLNFDGTDYSQTSGNGFLDYRLQTKYQLEDNQIVLSLNAYNKIFDTEWTTSTMKDFVPHKTRLKFYRFYDYQNSNALMDTEVEIVGLASLAYIGYVADNIKQQVSSAQHMDYGLAFSGVENISKAIQISEDLFYEQNLIVVTSINTMTDIVNVFSPIFRLIAIVLFVAVVFVFTSFSIKMIKAKMHDIGVLKALGSKNRTIVAIFGLQLLLVAICTCVMTGLGYLLFSNVTNNLLITSLSQLASGRAFHDLAFVSFEWSMLTISCIIIFVLAFISLLLPMFRIRKIKPVKIIKTKE